MMTTAIQETKIKYCFCSANTEECREAKRKCQKQSFVESDRLCPEAKRMKDERAAEGKEDKGSKGCA